MLVDVGARVSAEQVVARTELPGNVHSVNVANILSVLPDEVPGKMIRRDGEAVAKDEPIARSSTLFGLFKSVARSPIAGKVESVSTVTGQVLLREPPVPVEVNAYVDGEVVEVRPREGVVVETHASFVQGIFGIGGEAWGALEMVAGSPEDVLDASSLSAAHEGRVVVGGSLVTSAALERAAALGVRGVVGAASTTRRSGVPRLRPGVAITGTEDKSVTLVVTEGFGRSRWRARRSSF